MTTTPTNSTVSAEQLRDIGLRLQGTFQRMGDGSAQDCYYFVRDCGEKLLSFIAQQSEELASSGVCGAPSADPVAAGRSQSELAALIAGELAGIDGFDAADEHGGLYELRWSGGTQPEPLGDAWSMDYLPKGERIADAIRRRTHSTAPLECSERANEA